MPPLPEPPARNPRMFLLITGLVMLGAIPLDVILPSFPQLAHHFQVEVQDITYAISIFTGSFAFMQLFIGPLADRFGTRKVVIGSLLIAMVGGWLATISTHYATFLLARVIQAVGCACFALTQAIIQDEYRDGAIVKMRIYSTTASGVFISCAPLMGSYLQNTVGWQGSFWLFIAIAAVALCLTATSYRETIVRPRRSIRFYLATYYRMAQNRRFVGHWTITALAFSCHFSFIIASPLIFIRDMHMSLNAYSLIILIYGAAYVSGGFIATRLAKKKSTQALMRVGTAITACSGVLLISSAIGIVYSPFSVLVPMLFAVAGSTMIVPAATTEAMTVFGETTGIASSAGNLIRIFVGGLISMVISTLGSSIIFNITLLLLVSSAANLLILQLVHAGEGDRTLERT
jgi:MFS transporter, DHA1 family, multidrug resistance protein